MQCGNKRLRITNWQWVVLVAAVTGWSGCSKSRVDEDLLRSDSRPVTALESAPGVQLPRVSHAGQSETRLVEELIRHRATYARYLRVMATYYNEHGYDDKARWAKAELKDLQAVTPYRYIADGPTLLSPSDPEQKNRPQVPLCSLEYPAGVDLPTIEVAGRQEVDLVEEMILHRTMYGRFLRALAEYYADAGEVVKLEWALDELNDARYVKPYRYILDAITPVASLRPTQSIPEADLLYNEGLAYMKKGGHGTPVFYNQQVMKLALAKFKELVYEYPTSDKIDDAAFYIGEIHKEYFKENDNKIAVRWYKRAIDWNPTTPHPARFQMAVVYDYRLHEREEALRWYQAVLEDEADIDESNNNFSVTRIRQLTVERTRYAPGEPTPGRAHEPSGDVSPGGGAGTDTGSGGPRSSGRSENDTPPPPPPSGHAGGDPGEPLPPLVP